MLNFTSFYFFIIDFFYKKNKVVKSSKTHDSGNEFDGLSCNARVDLICYRLDIKKIS